MEDYYEYLDSNGVTTLYKLIKDDTVALIDSYSVTINGITTTLDTHINDSDIHTPISDIENMVDTKISGLVNSAPETLDTLKELSDALGNDHNFATTVANQIGNKASKDDVYTKEETDTLLEGKANSVHNHVVSDITDFPTIPTKVSELSNDSNFVTSTELHDYATKNDLNSKQDALSEEQLSNIDSIPDKANKSDLSTVATSGSYKDLLDKPVIPEGADLSDYYNKGETDNLLNSKANTSDLAVVAKSGNYSDLINTPTIPTKLSQLENDMGFGSGSGGVITSISWTNITDKPNFATVATSGSYNDLSNTPTIPTKVSQLENDTGFINALTDVVDTKSNQTIGGTKTFTQGIKIKNSDIDLTITPTSNKYSTYFFTDKNNALTAALQNTQRTYGVNDICFYVYDNSSKSYGFRIRTDNILEPVENNTYSLGSASSKWAKVYSDDIVHTSGNETITGNKTFTNQIYLGAGGTSYGQISAKDNNSILRLFGGTSAGTGANLDLYGENLSSGGFSLRARTSDKIVSLDGKVDGTLKWNGKNVALDENLVHRTGNETINGNKTFNNNVHCYSLKHPTDNSYFYISGGSDWNKGANLFLYGISLTGGNAGSFELVARNTTQTRILTGYPNGTLTWGGKNVAIDENLVHRSGNETINGVKYFNNLVYLHDNMSNKNSQMDLFTTPTNTLFSHYMFVDKNDEVSAYMQYGQGNTGTDFIGLFIHDKNRALHGLQVTTKNEVIPFVNNTYSLGSSSNRWANVHASRINCDNIVRTVENSYIYMTAGPAWNSGASIFLNGKSGDGNASGNGTFTLYARNASAERYLLGRPDGILNWTGCIESYEFHSTTGNAFMAQYGSYTFLIRNDGSNTYFLMSDKDGVPGTWSTARPLIINNATGVCSINGHADSATYADTATYSPTPATSDNSTRIATTAWVRNYVNSVVGSSAVGSSVSAYWSNSSNVTSTQQDSNERNYPECYSHYIDRTPGVGIIYSGAQLYSELNAHANATRELGGSVQNRRYITKVTAQATFSNPISSTGKYLCTTANTVSFRAYAPEGKSAASVINYSATKSIFIRVE